MISFFKEFTVSKKRNGYKNNTVLQYAAMLYISTEEEVANSSIKLKMFRGRHI